MFKDAEKRLNLISEGQTLIMKHVVFGEFSFKRNPQMNRIICTPLDDNAIRHEASCEVVHTDGTCHTTHQSIVKNPESCILWGYGEWSLEIEPPKPRRVVMLDQPRKVAKLDTLSRAEIYECYYVWPR